MADKKLTDQIYDRELQKIHTKSQKEEALELDDLKKVTELLKIQKLMREVEPEKKKPAKSPTDNLTPAQKRQLNQALKAGDLGKPEEE